MPVPNIQNLVLTYQSAFAAPATIYALNGASAITQDLTGFPQAGFTVECWVNTTQTAAGAVIFSYDDQAAGTPDRVWIKTPSALQVGFGTNPPVSTTLSVADGQWHHLAVTMSPATPTTIAVGIHVDGVLSWFGWSAIQRASGAWPDASADLKLGAGIQSEAGFVGQLSEFRLWNAVLTAQQIMTGMEMRIPPSTPGTVLVWTLDAAPPPPAIVTGGSFTAGSPALFYRNSTSVTANWTSLGEGYTYNVAVTASDNTYYAPTNVAAASYTLSTFAINTTYTISVQGVQGTTAGAARTSSVTTLDLWQPTLTTSQPGTGSFQLAWTSIDQALSYQVTLKPTGSAATSSTQTTTTFDLSTQAFGSQSWTYAVSALSGNVVGPATPVPTMPATPVLAFSYRQDAAPPGNLIAQLTTYASTIPYLLDIEQSGHGAYATPLLPAGTATYTQSLTPSGQIFTATARGVPTGAIGPLSASVSVTAQDILGPLITQISGDGTAHTISATWQNGDPGVNNPSYVAELWTTGTTPRMLDQLFPTSTSCTFTDSAIVNNATFQVRVRAVSGNSYGRWSNWAALTVGGLPQVTGVSAASDTSGNITVTWIALSQSGVSYVVRLYGNGVDYATSPLPQTTTTILTASATHVECNKIYNVTVAAQAAGPIYGPPSAARAVTACVPSVTPVGPTTPVSDPINPATGAYIYANPDMVVPAVNPLVMATYYTGSWPTPAENPLLTTPLGNRWSHSFMTRIATDASGAYAYVLWGNQQIDRYVVPGSVTGAYAQAGARAGAQLFRNADLTYTLTQPDATRYVFNSNGTLATIYDRYGNATALAYQNGLLQTVTDNGSGHKLTFGYSGAQLHTVTDQAGRVVTYNVVGGNLTSVVDPCNNTRTFDYTGASLMQSAVDGNNKTVFFNTYTGTQITKQQDARALADGQNYGTILNYQNTTQNGVAVVVTSGTDRAGNAISYTSLQANGAIITNQTALSTGQVQVTTRTYDGFNNLLTETVFTGTTADSSKGNTTTYTYDGNGNRITEVTPLDASTVHAVSRSFDASGNKLYEAVYEGLASGFQQGAGNRTIYTYYADNSLHTVTDPLGQVLTLTYVDGAIHGLVHTVKDPRNNVTTYDYQGDELQTVTNALGEVTSYGYDDVGRPQLVTVTGASGPAQRTTKYGYNKNNQIETTSVWYAGQTEQQAFTTAYGYDGDGNRTSVTSATGIQTILEYNPNNFLRQITYAPLRGTSRCVQYGYDNNDFIQTLTLTSSATNPLKIVSNYVCDAIGRVTKFTDANTNVYRYADAMVATGTPPYASRSTTTWPALTEDPGTYTDATTFDPIGRPIAILDRNGQTVTLAYTTRADVATSTTQNVVTITYPPPAAAGSQTTVVMVFDAIGRPVSVTDQASQVTSYAYGTGAGANNSTTSTVTITDPNNDTRTLAYDVNGQLVSETVGGGASARTFAFGYDAIGSMTSAAVTRGATTATAAYSYAYDAATKTIAVSIGRPGFATGATLQYYDGDGRLVRQVDPFNCTATSTYTPWGSLDTYTNGRNQTFTYTADDAGRLKQTAVTGGTTVVYTLDGNGNRLSTVAGSQTIGCTFDAWNRLLTRTGVEGAVIGYRYWPTDQVKTLTYSDGKTVAYEIDHLQRLTTVTDWHAPGRVTSYGYTTTNLLHTITFANGALATYAFDPGGRLTGITHQSGGWIVAQWQAQLDAVGELKQASVIEPLPPSPPSAPNTFTYTDGNQFLSLNGATAAYDNDGDYLGVTAATAVVTYDVYGRVSGATLPGLPAAAYVYDPDGLRTSATIGGTVTHSVFDVNAFEAPAVERGDPVRALAITTTLTTVIGAMSGLPVYAGGEEPVPMERAVDRMLELRDAGQAIQYRFVYGIGVIAQEDAAGNYRVYHADQVGNTWAMTDASGVITDGAVFGPFGAPCGAFGATATPFRYGGQFGVIDDGTGLLYMRARSYMPAQFRFLQPDYLLGNPFRPQSFNQYAYVRGNPLQAVDPLGLDAWKIVGWTLLGILGAGVLGGLGYLGYTSGFFSSIGGALSGGFSRLFGGGRGGGYRPVPRQPGSPSSSPPSSPSSSPPPSPRGPSGGPGDYEMTTMNQYNASSQNTLRFRPGAATNRAQNQLLQGGDLSTQSSQTPDAISFLGEL